MCCIDLCCASLLCVLFVEALIFALHRFVLRLVDLCVAFCRRRDGSQLLVAFKCASARSISTTTATTKRLTFETQLNHTFDILDNKFAVCMII